MLPWCAGLLDECSDAKGRKTAMALGTLLLHADEGWRCVLEDLDVEIDAVKNGYILLQPDVTSAAALASAQLRRDTLQGTLRMETLDQSGVRELEPALSDSATAGGGYFFPEVSYGDQLIPLILHTAYSYCMLHAAYSYCIGVECAGPG
jgi:hypothetical protein